MDEIEPNVMHGDLYDEMVTDPANEIIDHLDLSETRIMPGEDVLLQEMYDDIARENVLHPDDDFERIIEIMVEQIAEEHG